MGYRDDELAARGLLNPVTVVDQSEARLERLQPEARAAFATLCAQRLMDAHLRLPSSEQRPFTLSWVPILQMIWTGLEEPIALQLESLFRTSWTPSTKVRLTAQMALTMQMRTLPRVQFTPLKPSARAMQSQRGGQPVA